MTAILRPDFTVNYSDSRESENDAKLFHSNYDWCNLIPGTFVNNSGIKLLTSSSNPFTVQSFFNNQPALEQDKNYLLMETHIILHIYIVRWYTDHNYYNQGLSFTELEKPFLKDHITLIFLN